MNLLIGQHDTVIGRPLEDINTPALLIDADGLEHNIRSMAAITADAPGRLRPHCKTHKSVAIARMQTEAGAQGVCCAKLSEAAVIANGGVSDIMVTTPVVGGAKLEQLAAIARKAKTTVVLDDARTLPALAAAAEKAQRQIEVVVEVDVGQGRCGVPPGTTALGLVEEMRSFPALRFKGLHGYQGKLQMVAQYQKRRQAVRHALDLLLETAEPIRRAGYGVDVLTGGGTGTVTIDIGFAGLNEYQAGSYVFMDASYRNIAWDEQGNLPPFRCALTILGTVVSRPSRDRAIVDIGWKSASCDSGPPVPTDETLTFDFAGDEHGIIMRRDGGPLGLALDTKVSLVPSHCDTTVNLYDTYHVTRTGCVEALWTIDGRGHSQ